MLGSSLGLIARSRLLAIARSHAFAIVLGLSVVVTVLPLWVVRHIPAVDVPQHTFLVEVLSHLRDPHLPYREIFYEKPGLTYLAFYYPTRVLSALFGADTAIRIWLTLMLAGIPVAMAVLLRALGKSPWLALLACPLVFTDNFYWGFISFQSSITFTLLSVAFFIMTLEEPQGSRRYPWLLFASGASLLLVQATHGAAMIFPAAALPLMLVTTRSDWPRRVRAMLALVPGVAMLLLWVLGGVEKGRERGALGEPWKAHSPLFHRENFVFHALDNKPRWFVELLSNGFRGDAERPYLYAVAAAAALGVALAVAARTRSKGTWVARSRPLLLGLLGASLFLFLPSEITGYMSPIDSRYAQVAALLAIPVLGVPEGRLRPVFVAAAVAAAVYAGLGRVWWFCEFDREASSFDVVAGDIPPGSRIMHLVLDWSSRVATHPVYLHYAALAAANVGGVPSFSLAIDPSYPVGYRAGKKPPGAAWEWRPAEFDWQRHATYYDYFLIRGPFSYDSLFRGHRAEVQQVRAAAGWTLARRLPP